ncbi:hypothetical protein EYC84_000053 [Monilinia fructicola]|uniref:Carrier domain-containing protein n=1 Tax=Monilinia fructicola TaxID=38448 RepID=A0A5M9JUY3_MONFR|nr:hypothetical protein EYC84_000053 [Monilinia fructicola]
MDTKISCLNDPPRHLSGPQLLHDLIRWDEHENSCAIDFTTHNRREKYGYKDIQACVASLVTQIESTLRSNQISQQQQQHIVPILLPQSPGLYISQLAILQSGGAFCPINLDAPKDRIKFVVGDISASIIITTPEFQESVSWESGPTVIIVNEFPSIPTKLEGISEPREPTGNDLAYVMYTSGSSGTPKGVAVSHLAASQSLLAHEKLIPKFERFLQFAAPSFDVSVFEIFFPLTRGQTLVGCNRSQLLNDLPGMINQLEIDAVELTPTVVGALLQKRAYVPKLKLLMTIGEMLTRPIVEEFGGSDTKDSLLYGMYGPTEAAIHCTIHPKMEANAKPGNIGVPFETVSAFIAKEASGSGTEQDLRFLPQGELGELILSGPQLADGYLNREEQNKAAFVTMGDKSYYRTGDKGRILADGSIEIHGRMSGGQVKLRGQRVELGEVEDAVYKHQGIKTVVAVVLSGVLIVFALTNDDAINSDQVLRTCSQWLPNFMVPSEIIILREFPYLPSGKVDKRKLEANYQQQREGEDDLTNLTQTEITVREVLRDVLGSFPSNIRLAAAGLDSLVSIKVSRELRLRGFNVTTLAVLKAETLSSLVKLCQTCPETPDPAIMKASITNSGPHAVLNGDADNIEISYPCTPLQNAMLAETALNQRAYRNWVELELPGITNIDYLRTKLHDLAHHNHILRTGFAESSDNSGYIQFVWKNLPDSHIQNVDAFAHDLEIAKIASLHHPIYFQILSNKSCLKLLIHIHHALYDAWSMDLLLDDFDCLLRDEIPISRPSFAEVVNAYGDGRLSFNSQFSKDYWKDHMSDLELRQMPNFHSQKVSSSRLAVAYHLTGLSTLDIELAAKRMGSSPQAIFQAAYAIILASYLGSSDVCFGTVFSGRTLPIAGIEDIVGPCLATLPVRIDTSTASTLQDLVEESNSINRKHLEYSTLPLRNIKSLNGFEPRQQLFDTLLIWQQTLHSRDHSRKHVLLVDQADQLEFNLTLEITPTSDTIHFKANYQQSVFPESQIAMLLCQLEEAAKAIIENSEKSPENVFSESNPEILSIENSTPSLEFGPETLISPVERIANEDPDRSAIAFASKIDDVNSDIQYMSYGALNNRANQLGHYLSDHGVLQDDIICICLEKSHDFYASILAIAKVGAGYLPVTPDTPPDRLQHILREAKVKALIGSSVSRTTLEKFAEQEIIYIDEIDLSQHSTDNLTPVFKPENISYCVFTSGSTGTPKGWRSIRQPVTRGFFNLVRKRFDVSVFEIFFTWRIGGCLCSAVKDVLFRDIELAIRVLDVTHLSLTPTVAALIDPQKVPKVKFLVTAGEAVTQKVFNTWASRGLYQGYGPSETTNICTVKPRVTLDDRIDNIGPPFRNTSTFVLAREKEFSLVPRGGEGEFCFGGSQALESKLPSYMVPSNLIPVSNLPSTSQGKINKRSLVGLYDSFGIQYLDSTTRASRSSIDHQWTELELNIRSILADVSQTSIEDIGPNTSFFSFGIDSISAIAFSRELRQVMTKQINISDILKYATVVRLAEHLSNSQEIDVGNKSLANTKFDISEDFVKSTISEFTKMGRTAVKVTPCTPLQEAMLSAADTSSGAEYSNHTIFNVFGDIERLRGCWQGWFKDTKSCEPVFTLEDAVIEMEGSTNKDTPPYSLNILRSECEQRLLVSMHHALYDGVALSVLYDEVEKLYHGLSLPTTISFTPFLQHMKSMDIQSSDEFWESSLHGYQQLHLEDVSNRPNQVQKARIRVQQLVTKIPLSQIENNIKKHSTTSLAVFHSVWAATMSELFKATDVCFGNVVSGRTAPVDGIERLVAPCFNTIPTRLVDIHKSTYLEAFRKLQNANANSLPFQFTPLRRLQSKFSPNGNRLFDTLFILQQPSKALDSSIWSIVEDDGAMDFPLVCEIIPQPRNDTLEIVFHSSTSIFSDEDAYNLIQKFENILENALENPRRQIISSSLRAQIITTSEAREKKRLDCRKEEGQNKVMSRLESEIRDVIAEFTDVSLQKIGRDTSIFRLGLDSISTVQVASRLRAQGHNILASDVLQNPTVARVASYLEQNVNSKSEENDQFDFAAFYQRYRDTIFARTALPEDNIEAIRPCTAVQQGMLAQSLHSDGHEYINSVSLELLQGHSMTELSFEKESSGAQDEKRAFWGQPENRIVVNKFPDLTPLRIAALSNAVCEAKSQASLKELEDRCRDLGVTMQAAGQATWARLLMAYTGENATTFGMTLSGRSVCDNANLIPFPTIVTLPVSCNVMGSNSELLSRTVLSNAQLHRHQFTPLTSIQKWGGYPEGRIFDTLFAYQKLPDDEDVMNPPWKVVDEEATVDYVVSLEVQPTRLGEIIIRLSFREDIIPGAHAEIIVKQFDALLLDTLTNPDHPCSLAPEVGTDLLSITPAQDPVLPDSVTLLHQYVERGAKTWPDKVALEFATCLEPGNYRSQKWTYQQLEDEANKCAEASFAIIGIMKAGCGYVALDPNAPADRLKFIVEDSAAKLIITAGNPAQTLRTFVDGEMIDLTDPAVLCEFSPEMPQLSREITSSDISYCLYTSGTTGTTPKGCLLTHENAIQAMLAFQRLFAGHWTTDSKWLQFASFHFDVSVLEQFWSWSVGICVASAPRDLIFEDIPGAIQQLGITHIDLTPSLARLLHPDDVPSLCKGVFITGGEQLKQEILDVWGEHACIYNGYGPTEATIGVTMYPRVPKNGKPSNIGPQFDNVGSFVLKPGTELPVLRGGIGELCVSGKLVGKGYLNRPELTTERFPTLSKFNERVYRTGDLVRILHDGTFLFLGRADDQVKLRGQRLELSEINEVIKKSRNDLEEVVTLVLKHQAQAKEQLVTFFVASVQNESEGSGVVPFIRDACKSRLPGYMVPTHFIPIKALPLNANNKADSKQLAAIFNDMSLENLQSLSSSEQIHADWTEKEKNVVKDIVGLFPVAVPELTRSSNIFQLGIDSITMVTFSHSLRNCGYNNATNATVRSNPTIGSLVKALLAANPDESKENLYLTAAKQNIAGFSQQHIMAICKELGVSIDKIECIAPCTPVQEGMIYKFLESDEPLYFNRLQYGLKMGVYFEELATAWDRVVSHLQILRTKFVLTNDGFAQVVLKSVESSYTSTPGYLNKTDMLKSPWFLEKSGLETQDKLILNIFHGLYDGNSLGMMLNYLSDEFHNEPNIQYGPDFHSSLAYGPLAIVPEAEVFWKSHLRTWSPYVLSRQSENRGDFVYSRSLNLQNFEKVRKAISVAPQAIIQAAWMATIQLVISPNITTIGIVTSGRTMDFEEVEKVAGPLFNTVPFHLPIKSGTQVSSLVEQCHSINMKMQGFQHTPLAHIRKWISAGTSGPLFDILFVFQRPDVNEERFLNRLGRETVVSEDVVADYPLALEATLDHSNNQLSLQLVGKSSVATESILSILADVLAKTIQDILSSEKREIEFGSNKPDNQSKFISSSRSKPPIF